VKKFLRASGGETKLINLFVVIILVGCAITIWYSFRYDGRVPISEWVGVEVMNAPITPGQSLLVRIERKKVRDDCPVKSTRYAINSNGKAFPLVGEVSSGGPASADATLWMYPTPDTLPPGDYLLRVTLSYDCPEFRWTTQQPDGRFTVIAQEDQQ
jgi:hypothetical protein